MSWQPSTRAPSTCCSCLAAVPTCGARDTAQIVMHNWAALFLVCLADSINSCNNTDVLQAGQRQAAVLGEGC
jgi:hypothetical protein